MAFHTRLEASLGAHYLVPEIHMPPSNLLSGRTDGIYGPREDLRSVP